MKRESPGPDDTDDSGGEGKLAVARQPSAETFYQHTACEPQRISPYETFPDQDEESCPDRPKGVASPFRISLSSLMAALQVWLIRLGGVSVVDWACRTSVAQMVASHSSDGTSGGRDAGPSTLGQTTCALPQVGEYHYA